MLSEELIQGCLRFEEASQRELYQLYFNSIMHISVRYSKNPQEAKAILLDSFKNIFNGIKNYSEINSKRKKDLEPVPFEEWVKSETILAAIQHMHANKKEYFVSSTVNTRENEKKNLNEISDEQIIKLADQKKVLDALRQLTPSYRVIYNLHELDGYSHNAISKLLDISEYASKDSLLKAKFNLRKNIAESIPISK